jgi:hypothetical protein
MSSFFQKIFNWLWPPFPEEDDLDVLTYPKERPGRGDAVSEQVTIDVWSAPAPSSSNADMNAGKDETDPHAGREESVAQSDAAPETDPHAGQDFTVAQEDTATQSDTDDQEDTVPETDPHAGQDKAPATVEIVTARRGTDPADKPDLPGVSEKIFSNGGWIAFGEVEGVEARCCINPRASWQQFLMGDRSAAYNVRDDSWRGPDSLNHLRPAIVEWIQAEYADSREK